MVAEGANPAGEVMVGAAGEAPALGAPESARTANAVLSARIEAVRLEADTAGSVTKSEGPGKGASQPWPPLLDGCAEVDDVAVGVRDRGHAFTPWLVLRRRHYPDSGSLEASDGVVEVVGVEPDRSRRGLDRVVREAEAQLAALQLERDEERVIFGREPVGRLEAERSR